MSNYVYKNPYANSPEKNERVWKEMQTREAERLKLEQIQKEEEKQFEIKQKKVIMKVMDLPITERSKEKLSWFVRHLGNETKPFSKQQFRHLSGNYHADFLNIAIEQGIIIKDGEGYKVNFENEHDIETKL